MGDPCGVGPEVIVKAFGSPEFADDCIPFVIGDKLALERAIEILGSSFTVAPINDLEALSRARRGTIPLVTPAALTPADIAFGAPTPAACSMTVFCIEKAVRLALSGAADAICTCPINKEQLHRCGFPFPGHTEFIRDLTRADDVVMMLAGPRLRVALATIHDALSVIPGLLTRERLRKTIRITAEAMIRDFGLSNPRIAIAGLNPHAGEAGKFGSEEIDTLRPVIEEFANAAFEVSGPWPADTLFYRAFSGKFDAVVAMYHDQGLIPVKLAHFNEAVNVSLGLPIVRTSVDHGTAYDIAGTGKADQGSLIAAVKLASLIASNRQRR